MLCALPLLFCSGAAAAGISLNIADIAAPEFAAHGITLSLPQDGSTDLRIAELHIRQRTLRKVQIHCADFTLSTEQMSCRGGSLYRLPGMSVEFGYRFDTGSWQLVAQLRNVPGKGFAAWLPADAPLPSAGTLNGTLRASGDASGAIAFATDMQLAGFGFSDASGLHAAEKLHGTINLSATRTGKKIWSWKSNVAWQSGELFWQPLYLRGGNCGIGSADVLVGSRARASRPHAGGDVRAPGSAPCYKISASGSFDGTRLNVAQAVAELPEIGRVQLSALWDNRQGALLEGMVRGSDLALEKLFADYARPFLEKGALSESSLYGHADLNWRYRDGATQALRLTLRDVGIADTERRFALLGVNGAIDWRADAASSADITFAGGALLGAPLGAGQWTVQMRGMEFAVAQAVLPVMDGKLALRDFSLRRNGEAWRWQFGAALSGISMEQLSQAAGWPKMFGTLNGNIPRVSYDGGEVRADGALLFQVFDGTVEASRLRLADPFGRAPRLYGNLNMRGLDLDLLTRTFSFGNMQGRIDVDVNDLEFQDWRPARFDARIASSAGSYPKKISQKAVQNISALGGSGATAALQRSYLRFFENFGYDRIGWSCKLRNGVCAMGGAEDGEGGAYTIVRGGGIPAITVMGYNRSVSWDELLSRLKRVTQGNMQAVVK